MDSIMEFDLWDIPVDFTEEDAPVLEGPELERLVVEKLCYNPGVNLLELHELVWDAANEEDLPLPEDAWAIERVLNELMEENLVEETEDMPSTYRLTCLGDIFCRKCECDRETLETLLEANYVYRILHKSDSRKSVLSVTTDPEAERFAAQPPTWTSPAELPRGLALPTADYVRVTTKLGKTREALVVPIEICNTGTETETLQPPVPETALVHDVKLGATLFRSLAQATEEDLNSKVSIIRVQKSWEEAYKAVEYLAAIHYSRDNIIPFYCIDKADFRLDLCKIGDDFGENVIPLICVSDIVTPGFGSFMVPSENIMAKASGQIESEVPFWIAYDGPIALRCTPDDSIQRIIDATTALSHNRRVYILYKEETNDFGFFPVEGDDFYEEAPPSLIKVILKFDAAVYNIDEGNVDYYKLVLEELAGRKEQTIPADYPEAELVTKLIGVVTDFRAEMLEQMVTRSLRRNRNHTGNTGELDRKLIQLLGRVDCNSKNSLKGYDVIDSLAGMSKVKEQIKSLVIAWKYSKLRREAGLKALAPAVALFVGNPGTSKTTVAEALSEIMFTEGLLPGRRFVSTTGSGLVGEYLGSTVPKINDMFAKNDIIFIDEAYSLTENVKENIYAGEALAALCTQLEDAQNAGNKLIIFAGYGGSDSNPENNRMAKFLNSNPGIKSRVAFTVDFESYNQEECVEITLKLASNMGYKFSEQGWKVIEPLLLDYFSEEMKDPSFGNGRTCRALLQDAIRVAATRVVQGTAVPTEEDLTTLTPEDVIEAIRSRRAMNAANAGGRHEAAQRRIGF